MIASVHHGSARGAAWPGVAPVAAAVAELLREGWLADEAGWLEVAVSGLPP